MESQHYVAILLRTLGRPLALRLDVTDDTQVTSAVAAAADAYGRIDLLVNNAGICYFAGVEESDENDARRLFEINFFRLMRVTSAVLPLTRRQRAGTIVNMASIAGLNGFASVGYCWSNPADSARTGRARPVSCRAGHGIHRELARYARRD